MPHCKEVLSLQKLAKKQLHEVIMLNKDKIIKKYINGDIEYLPGSLIVIHLIVGCHCRLSFSTIELHMCTYVIII